jgi:quercetin 2,3-dioxygenase
MLEIRRADERGEANFGWLYSRHTFSFGHYHDPRYMGLGPLRVINDDRVQAGRGFDTHGHANMEIVSYVLDGALEHKDSMGNGSIIRPGEVQRMSAGTGVHHSEYNASDTEEVHFLQIWIIPEREGLEAGYEQIAFTGEEKQGKLRLVGSRDGRDGSVTIQQHVKLYTTCLETGDTVTYDLSDTRKGWVHVATGNASINGQPIGAGDGVAIDGGTSVTLNGVDSGELLLFDMG